MLHPLIFNAMEEKIETLDVVVLKKNLPSENLRIGAIGTVLEKFDDDTFLVEFADKRGVAYAMVELKASSLLKVHYEPIAA